MSKPLDDDFNYNILPVKTGSKRNADDQSCKLIREEFKKYERLPNGSIKVTTTVKIYYDGLKKVVQSVSTEIL